MESKVKKPIKKTGVKKNLKVKLTPTTPSKGKKIKSVMAFNVDNLKGQLNGTVPCIRKKKGVKKNVKKKVMGKKRKQVSEHLEKPLSKKQRRLRNIYPERCDPNEENIDIELMFGEDIGALLVQDSREEGRKKFQWIISPHTEENFFSNYWEKKPLHIKRSDSLYYDNIFTTKDFDKILHENLDITSYTDGKRETHNPIGQAHAPVVWDYFSNGCSVRMLNPQTFHRPVWQLLSSLQEYFNSFCGANIYLTPPDNQGFAPHWDDIEAFILQLEGKKHWRVYQPKSKELELPVLSSHNLCQDELGKLILDVTLEEGDLLYFPRGFVHQANTVGNTHSLHMTISTYQKNTWGHLLEKLLPQALTTAMAEDKEYRQGLPRDYLNSMGIVNMDKDSPSRNDFKAKVSELFTRLGKYLSIDAAVDEQGCSLMHDALPPCLTQEDKSCSVYGNGERWGHKKQKVIDRVELRPDTPIRLIRGNCLRVVAESDTVNVYHCLENTREYHQEEPQFVELVPENAPAIEALVHAYPKYLTVESLPLNDDAEKMAVASGLWERGLIVTATPLNIVDNK
ncbi:Ribosomal oxygenase 1-like [Homarus americanus]|uniref:Bifunctional lysine-specific demethylase and histidyl-hydroxylase n=1 Tax=Homarus americanus TaxID=6706 RepID=A0A8J5MR30_HOMAM|nr:Ribosomal oxygenase 1-like [Homarus americanus]